MNTRAIGQARAIIYRESGGDTDNYNVNNGYVPGKPFSGRGVDRGLPQWNSKAWPHISDYDAIDPYKATKQMFIVSGGGVNWGPWASSGDVHPPVKPDNFPIIRSGKFQAYAKAHGFELTGTPPHDVNNNGPGGPIGAIGDAIGAVGDVVDGAASAAGGVAHLATALLNPSTYLRVGKGLLGGILVIVGVGALVYVTGNKLANSPAVGDAAKLATKLK